MTTPRSEVRVARLLILLSIILNSLLVLMALIALTAMLLGRMPMAGAWPGGALLFLLLSGAGIGAGLWALPALSRGEVAEATRLALVAVLLPPPNLVMLLAGGLLYFENRRAREGLSSSELADRRGS